MEHPTRRVIVCDGMTGSPAPWEPCYQACQTCHQLSEEYYQVQNIVSGKLHSYTCSPWTLKNKTVTGSTIAPPPNQRYSFNERRMAARHKEWCYEENIFMHSLGCKGLSNDDIEVERGTVKQEIRPGAGFKTGDSVEERLGRPR